MYLLDPLSIFFLGFDYLSAILPIYSPRTYLPSFPSTCPADLPIYNAHRAPTYSSTSISLSRFGLTMCNSGATAQVCKHKGSVSQALELLRDVQQRNWRIDTQMMEVAIGACRKEWNHALVLAMQSYQVIKPAKKTMDFHG